MRPTRVPEIAGVHKKSQARLLIRICGSLLLLAALAAKTPAQSDVFPKWTSLFGASRLGVPTVFGAPNALVTDSQGDVYVTGYVCVDSACSDQEALTIKYDPNGKILWKNSLSGSSASPSAGKVAYAQSIGIDAAGNVYVVFGLQNQPASGAAQSEIVTAKYAPNGVRQWIDFISNSNNIEPTGLPVRSRAPLSITVSPSGNAYIAYQITYNDVPTTFDAAVVEYDTAGKKVWSQYVNSPTVNRPGSNIFAIGLGIDAKEDAFFCVMSFGSESAGYILKFNNDPVRSYQIIGNLGLVSILRVDPAGNSYVTSGSSVLAQPGDKTITKFNVDTTLAWTYDFDQLTRDPGRVLNSLAVDSAGNVFVGQTTLDRGPSTDITIAKLTPNGRLDYISHYNNSADGSSYDVAVATAVNSFGEAYVVGTVVGPLGGESQFVTLKYGPSGTQQWVVKYDGPPTDTAPVAMTVSGGNLFVIGTAGAFPGAYPGPAGKTDWVTIDYVQDAARFSASSLSFANQTRNTQSAPQSVTLTNGDVTPLIIDSITITGDFQLTNPCPNSLAPGSSCTLTVAFTPSAAGARTGTITVHDNWAGSATDPQAVNLTGTGIS